MMLWLFSCLLSWHSLAKPSHPKPLHPPTARINGRLRGAGSYPQGKLNVGQINCRLWLNTTLGTHTQLRQHTPYQFCIHKHARTGTHTHVLDTIRQHARPPMSIYTQPEVLLLCLQVAGTWQAAHSLLLSCGRGELSLFWACVRASHSEVASISVFWKRASHLCALCVCASGVSGPQASKADRSYELQGTEYLKGALSHNVWNAGE